MRISDWSSDVCSSDLLALGLKRRLVEALEQFEQRAHAAGAAGKDKMPDLIGQVQATPGGAQLQCTEFVFIGERAHLENQRQGETRLEIGQLHWQLSR